MNDLQCMLDAGVIDQETFDRLSAFARFTSGSQNTLLQLVAASALAGMGATAPQASDGPVLGVQELTATTGSGALGLTVPAGAKAAVITIFDKDALCRFDNIAPTAKNGHLLRVGDNNLISNLATFKFATTDTSSTAFISYY